jgi:hypothetical protein
MKFTSLFCIAALAVSLFIGGCVKNTNPESPPVDQGISGEITSAQTWDSISTIHPYHITGTLTIKAPVTWSRKITVWVDNGAMIDIEDATGKAVEIRRVAERLE